MSRKSVIKTNSNGDVRNMHAKRHQRNKKTEINTNHISQGVYVCVQTSDFFPDFPAVKFNFLSYYLLTTMLNSIDDDNDNLNKAAKTSTTPTHTHTQKAHRQPCHRHQTA